jgi:hypothetical protein
MEITPISIYDHFYEQEKEMQLYLDSYVHTSENLNDPDHKSDNSSSNSQPIFAMPIIFISDDLRMRKIKCVNINLNLNTRVHIDKKL